MRWVRYDNYLIFSIQWFCLFERVIYRSSRKREILGIRKRSNIYTVGYVCPLYKSSLTSQQKSSQPNLENASI